MSRRKRPLTHLSRRETQIMEILFALGEADVEQVHEAMVDRPSYDSVRVILRILKDKGLVTRRKHGRRHIYRPKGPVQKAKRAALRHVLDTFFHGSTPVALSALLDMAGAQLSDEELDELAAQIEAARRQKREKESQ
ncbi:MAG: BlaI/MecI/CopY family transcriptional regulator [Phycisphaerales bacterium]|nr:MAG: BlaI/MecI/CopY family transcriptional regulator [Phycisphaerales bacterium]